MSDTKLHGFTVIELLVAVAVFALIAAMGVPYGVSRVCNARHAAVSTGLETELFNARAFAVTNNRYVRVNVQATGDGMNVTRYYNSANNSACPPASTSGLAVLANRNFGSVTPIGFSNSYFCMNSEGRLVQHSYNAGTLLEHRCAATSYKLRINFVGAAGFFFLEEMLPQDPGNWRMI